MAPVTLVNAPHLPEYTCDSGSMCGPSPPPPPQRLITASRPPRVARPSPYTPRPRDKSTPSPHAGLHTPPLTTPVTMETWMDRRRRGPRTSLIEVWDGATASISASAAASAADGGKGRDGFTEVHPRRTLGKSSLRS
ncbi:unnamed protein product [Arctogadus glacialis]